MNSITGFEPNSVNPDKSFTLPLDNRNITFTTKDPYGFLEATVDEGVLPEVFTGRFTNPREAKNAVQRYLSITNDVPTTSVPVSKKK